MCAQQLDCRFQRIPVYHSVIKLPICLLGAGAYPSCYQAEAGYCKCSASQHTVIVVNLMLVGPKPRQDLEQLILPAARLSNTEM